MTRETKPGRQKVQSRGLLQTPLGNIWWEVSDQALCRLGFGECQQVGASDKTESAESKALHQQVMTELSEYFAGQRQAFEIPVDLGGSIFQKRVWDGLQQIAYAKTISYSQQAEMIQAPRAIRAVANANGANPIPIVIPCHRVIAKDGSLGGYGPGLEKKQWLLQHEEKYV